MAKLVEVQNGVTKKRNGSSRRASATAKRNGTAKRRGTTKAGALSWAKKNGLKMVSRSASKAVINPKRRKGKKRRRRNGIVSRSSRNGLLGNTKHDAQQVGGVLAGMAATKIISRFVNGFGAPYLAQVGLGNYAELISEGVTAVVIVPMIASKVAPRYKDNARLGGLAVVGITAIDLVSGGMFSQFNPFNATPVVLPNGQALVAPQAVTKLVQSTSATPEEKAKVASAMNALDAGAYPSYRSNSVDPSMLFE